MEDILVARRSLSRGHQVRAEDVTIAKRDVARFVGSYLSQADQIVGKRLTHAVAEGMIITPSILEAQVLIERGQSVMLVVNNDSLNIMMSGTALMDGAANQRIRVKNTGSGRIVEGVVRSSGRVEVMIN
jgi:flagella basal body P-ring formation protein FlgA